MGKLTILTLRIVLAVVLAGSLLVQVWMVPLLSADMEQAGVPTEIRIPFLLVVVLGIMMAQVSVVCVWRLLTMVRRGSVFSHAAFRYVNIVFAAVATASVLVFTLAVMLAPGDVAPGVVGLVCGASLLIAGVALLVLVLRTLLAQAVAVDAEAKQLRSELGEVI